VGKLVGVPEARQRFVTPSEVKYFPNLLGTTAFSHCLRF